MPSRELCVPDGVSARSEEITELANSFEERFLQPGEHHILEPSDIKVESSPLTWGPAVLPEKRGQPA